VEVGVVVGVMEVVELFEVVLDVDVDCCSGHQYSWNFSK
jgi:hypothetical protein